MPTSFENHWFLTGPTASGKTAVGIELARTLGAEIVSMDSMAVFRHMDIGTAKPSRTEQSAVRHHLIDIVEPQEDFSLAEYLGEAARICKDIESRGKVVLFVGGTPLYLKALLRGMFQGPPANWELRRTWQSFLAERGNKALHEELAKVDPVTAARLPPEDTRRIIRALEIFQVTGESITHLQQQFQRSRPASECRVFALNWPRPKLIERINARVDAMMEAGWVEEVQRLMAQPPLSRTAAQAVGYREIVAYLRGEESWQATVDLVKIRTRQFAKRQLTWLRSLSECGWVEMDASSDSRAIADKIARFAELPDVFR